MQNERRRIKSFLRLPFCIHHSAFPRRSYYFPDDVPAVLAAPVGTGGFTGSAVTSSRISRSRLITSIVVGSSASQNLRFSSSLGSLTGATTRKPIQNPSVIQCGLLGIC